VQRVQGDEALLIPSTLVYVIRHRTSPNPIQAQKTVHHNAEPN